MTFYRPSAGVWFPRVSRHISFHHAQIATGVTQPFVRWVPKALFTRGKLAENETEYSSSIVSKLKAHEPLSTFIILLYFYYRHLAVTIAHNTPFTSGFYCTAAIRKVWISLMNQLIVLNLKLRHATQFRALTIWNTSVITGRELITTCHQLSRSFITIGGAVLSP
jgi:hypothetical protein